MLQSNDTHPLLAESHQAKRLRILLKRSEISLEVLRGVILPVLGGWYLA